MFPSFVDQSAEEESSEEEELKRVSKFIMSNDKIEPHDEPITSMLPDV